MQQREEKNMETFLENSLIKLTDLKKAIAQMIQKIGKIEFSLKRIFILFK